MRGVSEVTTDQPKLQASLTFDDEKVKLEEILDKLKGEYSGRYAATLAKK